MKLGIFAILFWCAPAASFAINEGEAPLALAQGNWSLISLIFAALVFVVALVLMVFCLRRSERSEDGKLRLGVAQSKRVRLPIFNGVIALLGVAPAAILLIMDDITATMVLINQNTILVAVVALVAFGELALIITCLVRRTKRNQDDSQP